MKKRFFSMMSIIVLLYTSISCAFSIPLPDRMADIVEYATDSQAMSDEEWERVEEDYYLLADEFRANLSTYSEEEKQQVYELMGRMNGLIAKREAGKFMEELNEISTSLPSIIDGFVQGLTGENN